MRRPWGGTWGGEKAEQAVNGMLAGVAPRGWLAKCFTQGGGVAPAAKQFPVAGEDQLRPFWALVAIAVAVPG